MMKTNRGWEIGYERLTGVVYSGDTHKETYETIRILLHPDDKSKIDSMRFIFDDIEGRILNQPDVDFDIIDNYAKIRDLF